MLIVQYTHSNLIYTGSLVDKVVHKDNDEHVEKGAQNGNECVYEHGCAHETGAAWPPNYWLKPPIEYGKLLVLQLVIPTWHGKQSDYQVVDQTIVHVKVEHDEDNHAEWQADEREEALG